MTNFVITAYKNIAKIILENIYIFLVSRFKGENRCQNSITKKEVFKRVTENVNFISMLFYYIFLHLCNSLKAVSEPTTFVL